VLLESLDFTNVDVLSEDWRHNPKGFLALQETDVLLIRDFLWLTWPKALPLSVENRSLSEDLTQQRLVHVLSDLLPSHEVLHFLILNVVDVLVGILVLLFIQEINVSLGSLLGPSAGLSEDPAVVDLHAVGVLQVKRHFSFARAIDVGHLEAHVTQGAEHVGVDVGCEQAIQVLVLFLLVEAAQVPEDGIVLQLIAEDDWETLRDIILVESL